MLTKAKTLSTLLAVVLTFMTIPSTILSADTSGTYVTENLMSCYNSDKSVQGRCFFYEMDNKYNKVDDLFGNTYGAGDGCYVKFGSDYSGNYAMTVDFYLNGKYEKLTTGLAIVEYALENETAEVLFYSDDVLIYKQGVTNRTAPDDIITLDMTGVKWLTVEFKLYNKSIPHRLVALVHPTLYAPIPTGWQKVGSSWQYLDKNGNYVTSWQKIDGSWYYFDYSGIMLTGWKSIKGKWYYLSSSGAMLTGWQFIGNQWYYMNSSGEMLTGWQYIGNYYYYFKSSGAMASHEYCDGYWLDSGGSWTYQHRASWRHDSTGWWYGDNTGWYAKNQTLTIDGKKYNFNSSGYCTNP